MTRDAARTAAARRLLDAGAIEDNALQTLAGVAVQLLGTRSAEISLLTDERVIVAAVDALPGLAGTRTSLESALCTQAAAEGAAVVVTDAAHDPRTAHLAGVARGELGAYVAVPVVSDNHEVVGAFCAYEPVPRAWDENDVETLRHLAAAAAARLEVGALDRQYGATSREALLTAAVDAAAVGTFQWDLRNGALRWDTSLLEAFQYDEETFGGTIDAFDARVHTDDLPQVTDALERAIASCGVYEAEFRVCRPDGTTRWLVARGRALPGVDGRAHQVVGVTTDTTALRLQEDRVREVLEGMSVGYYRLDADWRFAYVNAEAERILGQPRTRLLGEDVWELFPAAVGAPFQTSYRHVAATGEGVVFDAYYPAPLDAWYEVRAVPERGGVAAFFTDVTARRRALDAAQRAEHRATLLGRVGTAMAEVQEPVDGLRTVLTILVPALADFAIASVLEDGAHGWQHHMRDVAGHHRDPRLQPVLEEYLEVRVPALTTTSPAARALATGRPAAVVDAGRAESGQVLEPGEAATLLQRLTPHATVVFPLRGRGQVRGMLTLVNGPARGTFTPDDVAIVQDAVAQIGLALDNAQLQATRRNLVEELQRSLLTRLPEPDHLQLAARYVPAAAAAQVGGDWYDAFLVRDGATCLVIGDVTGHDLHAAVAMAQIRNVLRGGAHAVVNPPAKILQSLDWAMHDLGIDVLSSGILAKIEQPAELAERGQRLLRWSNAGHLPPLLLHPDGTAELLSHPTDLLLGVHAHTSRTDHTHVVASGSTVLLYTDGLVERRGESLTEGLERLRTTVERHAHVSLEQLCDVLIADLAHDSPDDVALLAVRAHDEDQPRPAEAGPRHVPAEERAAG
ncbi:SpoIIE family protein phosphatase [Cellulomonas sp. ATA003]|uniref:SpoIIE family protein phosphatase n=1 Tax=Cellulomonas sp. ATA003 TaxID=3073064 RepID=UPI002872F842|nr:SpoIIE family protein phosphatase [Cellulomonas sp. ATA003]WNB86700.1 SpoIIE family protein phosphatase [Cellulomonas sp. ATA003]